MNDQEIALIRRFRPAGPPDDPAVKARAWARLQREFGSGLVRRRSLQVRIGRRVAIAGVMVVAASVIFVGAEIGGVLPYTTPRSGPHAVVSDGPPRSMANATLKTLELAAATVEHETAPSRPGPRQWVYTQKMTDFAYKSDDAGGLSTMLRGKVKVEEWWRFDGKEMAKSVQDGQLLLTRILRPGERPRPGRVDPRYNGGFVGGPAFVNNTPNKLYDYVAGLPTDPDALLARIRKDYRDNGRDVTTFGVIAKLFRDNQLIPPKTNAALYRALAKIPGVRVIENAMDYAGRQGIGVAFDRGSRKGNGQLIVLNPKTYRYMGDTHRAILGFAVVDKPGQRQ
ncbi:CU044_5270 family protein [Streptosporangium sp. NBC_01495]|uniref:CU044_5270 family protein n=1 Tax=Streptosporangium sp. NBC_01495 TaxID=2903899 RepID=UPI002E3542B9|nr:CU044_5270 family protein [Streptosporangium sp. NBC_01495]